MILSTSYTKPIGRVAMPFFISFLTRHHLFRMIVSFGFSRRLFQREKMSNRRHEMYSLWATAWLAKKRGIFDQYAPLFTPAVLTEVAKNLKDDQQRYNASQAVRLFLLVGDQSLPTLREATKSSDNQTASLARATIDALSGKRNAFGFLA